MTFRHFLTLHFCPLIIRLVLALTFIWFGFGKFKTATYTGVDAGILISLGVGDVVANAAEEEEELPPSTRRFEFELPDSRLALRNSIAAAHLGYQDEETDDGGDGADEVTDPVGDDGTADETEGTDELEAGDDVVVEPVVYELDKTVEAAKYHRITIMLHQAGHSYPKWMALIAVLTEAVGGVLILVGLFTRIWGLGLAIAMGYAFYFTSWVALTADVDPLTGSLGKVYSGLTSMGTLGDGDQISAFFQLCCFGLSLVVFLGGPGKYSLDHLIFRARSAPGLIMEDADEEI